ncbi:MAG: transposase [Chloroflexi bacterium]|jgi:putative transposase|nr:transposase [Chloroflexota bacterium]
MILYKDKYHTETTRLADWDYTGTGWYFVTVCTRNREESLGRIVDGELVLSRAGHIVGEEWAKTAELRLYVHMDQMIIMPNHVHGIVVIIPKNTENTTQRPVETPRRVVSTMGLRPNSLGSIMGQIKSVCTKRIRSEGFADFAWQTRFYDHIIRDQKELQHIRQYILDNPPKWEIDRNNPANLNLWYA